MGYRLVANGALLLLYEMGNPFIRAIIKPYEFSQYEVLEHSRSGMLLSTTWRRMVFRWRRMVFGWRRMMFCRKKSWLSCGGDR